MKPVYKSDRLNIFITITSSNPWAWHVSYLFGCFFFFHQHYINFSIQVLYMFFSLWSQLCNDNKWCILKFHLPCCLCWCTEIKVFFCLSCIMTTCWIHMWDMKQLLFCLWFTGTFFLENDWNFLHMQSCYPNVWTILLFPF